MKECRTCGVNKPISEFYKHPEMADGHINVCSECKRRYARQYREENLEIVKKKERIRGRTEAHKKSVRAYHAKNAEIVREAKKRWIGNNPEKRKAHNALCRAVREGKIKRGCCDVCGKKNGEGHHPDYSKPLEVVWLCRQCHAKLHRIYD